MEPMEKYFYKISSEQKFYSIYLFWIFFLTLSSGFLNSLGILSIGAPVSHFSGNLSRMAITFHKENSIELIKLSSLFLAYFVGCVLAGFFIRTKEFSLKKRYGLVLLSISAFLGIVYLFFLEHPLFLYLLPTILGLQNGMFISYRGVVVRTTHITGNLTDAGVYLGKSFRGEKQDTWKMIFYLANIACFFLGCLLGARQYVKLGKEAFLYAAILYAIEGLLYFFLRRIREAKEK